MSLNLSIDIQPSIDVVLICLHADPVTPPGTADGGGTHSYIREVLSLLLEKKINHLFLTRWADPSLLDNQKISDYGYIRRLKIGPAGPMHKSCLNNYHKITVAKVKSELKEFGKPNLLHSIYWNSGRAAMDISQELRIPFVHTVISNGWRRKREGYLNHTPERINIEKEVYKSAAKVLCICSQEAEDLVTAYNVPRKNISIVGRPVSAIFQAPARDGYGRPRRKYFYQNRSFFYEKL